MNSRASTSSSTNVRSSEQWRGHGAILIPRALIALIVAGLALAPLAQSFAAGPAQLHQSLAAHPSPTIFQFPAPAALHAKSNPAVSPFTCASPTIFLSQASPTQLYGGVYGAGKTTFTKIGSPHSWAYNAMGYNPSDRYLYSVSLQKSTSFPAGHLLRITGNGTIQDLKAISGDSYLKSHGATTGAFDGAGSFWVTSPAQRTVDEINLITSPPKVVKKVAVSAKHPFLPADFSWDSGFMWGMQGSSKKLVSIYRLSLANGKVTTFPAPKAVGKGTLFGAAWTYGNGNLGFLENANGEGFQVLVANAAAAKPTFTVVSTYSGPKTNSSNDGATCVPNPVDLGITVSAPTSAAVESAITWKLKVENNGPGISSGYAIDDALPVGVTHVSTTSAGCKVTGSTLGCAEGQLAVGASYTVSVTGDAPLDNGACLVNTADVTGNEQDPNAANNSGNAQTCLTQPSPTIGGEAPTPSTGPAGSHFADKVTLSGGASPTGTIMYKLYGPSQPTCQGTPQATVSTPVAGNGTFTSPSVAISVEGSYWWVATYSGDSNNGGATTSCSSGLFSVTKAAPTLGSEAPAPSSDVQGSTFKDQVTLASGASPTGTITYSLYGPSQPTCQGTPQQTITSNVTGNGTYTSPGIVINTPGTYWWVASYPGDANNQPAAATPCSDGVFTVTKAQPQPCTIHWAGPASGGQWAVAANWDLNRLPDSSDIVCLGTSASPLTGPVDFDGSNGTSDTTITQLEGYAALDITGGELLITDTSSDPTQQSFVSGLSMSSGQLGDTSNAEAGLIDNGGLTWSGGSFEAPTSQASQPELVQTSGSSASFTGGGTLSNWGLSLASPLTDSATTYVSDGSTITESAQVTLQNGANVYQYQGAAGSFTVTSSSSIVMSSASAQISVPSSVAGPINLSGGTLYLYGAATIHDFTVASGANLAIDALSGATTTVAASSTNSGAGTLTFDGYGTVDVDAPLDVTTVQQEDGTTVTDDGFTIGSLTVSGGELDPSGTAKTYSVTSSLTLSGGTIGDASDTKVGNLSDAGSFTWSGGTFEAPTGETAPTFTQSATSSTVSFTGGGSLTNWDLSLAGPLTDSATTYVSDGSAITESAQVTLQNGADLYQYLGALGSFTVNSGGSIVMNSSGGTAQISVPSTVVGAVTVSAGTLGLYGAATIHNFTVASGANLVIDAPSGATTTVAASSINSGAGTLTFNGSGTVDFDAPLIVTTVQQESGTTVTDDGFTDGALSVSNGELDPSGTTKTYSVTSSLTLSGGTIGDAGDTKVANLSDAGSFTWSGGTFEAPTGETAPTFTQSATSTTVTFTGGGSLTNWDLSLASPLTDSGTTYVSDASKITESAQVTLQSGANIYQYQGAPGSFTVTSGSSIVMNSSGGTAQISVPSTVVGPITVTAGTLDLYGAASIHNFTVASGANLAIDAPSGGTTTVAASSTNSGAGTLTFDGNGTVDFDALLDISTVQQESGTTVTDDGFTIASFSVSGGELDPSGMTKTYSVLSSFTLSGGTLGDATDTKIGANVSDGGSFTWSGGTFEAPTSETAPTFTQSATSSSVSFTNGGSLTNWDLSLAGALTDSGTTYVSNGSKITESAQVALQNGADLYQYMGAQGTFTVTSAGSLNLPSTGGTASISVALKDQGALNLNLGTLNLSIGAVLPSSISSLSVSIGGTTTGSYGVLVVTGGSLTLSGTMTETNVNGFAPSHGNSFNVVTDSAALGGTFSNTSSNGYNITYPSGTAVHLAFP